MNNVAIMLDSGAGIDKKEAKELGVYLLEMPLTVNGKEIKEEISIDKLAQLMEEDNIVKTASPIMGEIIKMYDQLLEENDYVIYIPLSRKLSGTYNLAKTIANDYNGRVIVIDALCAAYCITVVALMVKDLINKGVDPLKIQELVENETYMWAELMPYDLKYLKNGGRISKAAASLGNLLKIVPILKIEDGAIDVFDKVRTHKKAVNVALKTLDIENKEDYIWLILHSNCYEEAMDIKKDFEDIVHQEVIIHELGSVIMAHTGPNTIGVGYVKKIKYED